ncbi:UdgX family uracil-DNA binding protein [Teichococcus oryzae]|uniref:Type-4 uracil-DNA glycosylase n=1 Tax=Teichococcus oryzae TaxID=1608942 RepID=A0A5B2TI42_9PROT|nr:UdgX family uracil-DNA binding protein [Pseudoroseomonas oryzae]KAA2213450.1 UdgX family uracil-DNA binding protein [Pseudoroseomonas oryzae]
MQEQSRLPLDLPRTAKRRPAATDGAQRKRSKGADAQPQDELPTAQAEPAEAARARLSDETPAEARGDAGHDRRPADHAALPPVIPAPWAEGRAPVLGEGPLDAPLMLVGEQPGDEEDRGGRPFIGPAGRLLDRALVEAGIDRSACYVTNAVKHFKYVQRGARRLHQTPDAGDIAHYRPFLMREIVHVAPGLLVAMGATAAQALLGRKVGIMKLRGQVLSGPGGMPILLTVHPSFLLRLPDPDAKRAEYGHFVHDLGVALQRVPEIRAG